MVSVDIYLNETTRHADVILPGLSPLEQSHYDVAFPQLSVRNYARYSPPVFEPPPGAPEEWQVLLRLLGVLLGQGPKPDVDALDALVIGSQVQAAVRAPGSPIEGRDADEILAALDAAPRARSGSSTSRCARAPTATASARSRTASRSTRSRRAPHGIDLGPLEPRIPEVLRTPSGQDRARAGAAARRRRRGSRASLDRPATGPRCWSAGATCARTTRGCTTCRCSRRAPRAARSRSTPTTPRRAASRDGGAARVTSRVGSVEAPVEVTDAIMPGVVSLPHGWGHDEPGTRLAVAARAPGRQQQRAHRRARARSALGQRGAERDPGRGSVA